MKSATSVLTAIMFIATAVAQAEEIGSVDTAKTMIGPQSPHRR